MPSCSNTVISRRTMLVFLRCSEYGYASFAIGMWHNTRSEETTLAGPYDRWPTGDVFGFHQF